MVKSFSETSKILDTNWLLGKSEYHNKLLFIYQLVFFSCQDHAHLDINILVFNLQQLLEVLHSALPKMSLVVSDFSYLPEVIIPGDRAPLVSTKVISSA